LKALIGWCVMNNSGICGVKVSSERVIRYVGLLNESLLSYSTRSLITNATLLPLLDLPIIMLASLTSKPTSSSATTPSPTAAASAATSPMRWSINDRQRKALQTLVPAPLIRRIIQIARNEYFGRHYSSLRQQYIQLASWFDVTLLPVCHSTVLIVIVAIQYQCTCVCYVSVCAVGAFNRISYNRDVY
jgi:hypothetical protein